MKILTIIEKTAVFGGVKCSAKCANITDHIEHMTCIDKCNRIQFAINTGLVVAVLTIVAIVKTIIEDIMLYKRIKTVKNEMKTLKNEIKTLNKKNV